MEKVIPFQIRLVDRVNRAIKSNAANNSVTKHEWIEEAIAEKLAREGVTV